MYFVIKKAKIVFLFIFTLNKSKISQVIEILRKYSKFFGSTDNIISKKLIIVKRNWLIVRNMLSYILIHEQDN